MLYKKTGLCWSNCTFPQPEGIKFIHIPLISPLEPVYS